MLMDEVSGLRAHIVTLEAELEDTKLQVDVYRKWAAEMACEKPSRYTDGAGFHDFMDCDECIPCKAKAEKPVVEKQLSEVTAHRDRLRDMLNDVRGMAFTDQPELAARILRRIDPVEDEVIEKRKCVAGCMDRHFCHAPKLHEGGCHCKLEA